MNYAIGVDIGGTHIWAGLINKKGKILAFKKADFNLKEKMGKIITDVLIPTVDSLLKTKKAQNVKEKILGIGIGIPGSIDSIRGIIKFTPNFNWKNIKLGEILKEHFDYPVHIINDVNAATLGEKYFGAGKNTSDFICITMGTGIGGGIIANNELIIGHEGFTGEIGHIIINPDGKECTCGNLGCMEEYASLRGITATAKNLLKYDTESSLHKYKDELTPKKIYYAAKDGDKIAKEVWKITARYLGIGLANCVTILNPQKIIFGGRISTALPLFKRELIHQINMRARMIPKNSTKILKAKLGDRAGMIGAASLIFKKNGVFK
ncbi:MAG: ROK family protein [Armatimonadota bacterium]